MARPLLYHSDTDRLTARRSSYAKADRKRRSKVAPEGIAWVPTETMRSILGDIRASLLVTPGRRVRTGGTFLYLGQPARSNFR